MFLKACLNGSRSPADHPALPFTPAQLAADARRAVEAGADALHIHPRDAAGCESLAPEPVAETLLAIREACPGVPVGVSTGAWIEPDVSQRVARMEGWTLLPDFVSLNLSEPGALQVLAVLVERGVGLEAGIWSADDARYLLTLTDTNWLRLLFEPTETEIDEAHATVDAIEDVLAGVLPTVPRLLHGTDRTVWAMLERAARSDYGSRVGFEDTLHLPAAKPAPDNAALVAVARALCAGPACNLLS